MSEAYANPPNNDAWKSGKGRFLIDGFPRKMDQALMFDKVVSTRVRDRLMASRYTRLSV
jgi:adenylate kinase family enzyme